MNKFLTLLLMALPAIAVSAEVNDAIDKAHAEFSRGRYREGRDILNKALRGESPDSPQRNQILSSLGDFNCEYVGNFDTAITFYSQIVNSDSGDDQDMKIQAQEKIAGIEALKRKFSGQDILLKELSARSSKRDQPQQTKADISRLKNMALQNPDYYRIAEVYFHLGRNEQNMKNYGEANRWFEKATASKPAISFFLPIETCVKMVGEEWRRERINKATWGPAGALLVIIALTYYLSRPWKWMRPRHVIVGLGMIALWWGVFTVSHTWLGKRYVMPASINPNPDEPPKYCMATPGSHGSEIAGRLFRYGAVGLTGLYVFALGASRLKSRRAAFFANGVMGLLILSVMTTIFYMRHCYRKSDFISEDKGIMFYAAGDLYFEAHGPVPCVLTNPKAYPNPSLANAKGEFKEWLLRHCKFDKPPKEEGGAP